MARGGRSTGARRAAQTRGRAPPPSRRQHAPGSERRARSWWTRIDLSDARLRAFAEHPDATAALLLALFVLAYLWPVLLGGKILSPISVLYNYTPWQARTPADIHSYSNILLVDVPLADYPWRAFARALIHQGTFPAWNPHVFAGTPFFSNPQTGIFSLFSLPLWILPLNYGIGVGAALKLWAGGFGTYLLVRQLRLGFLPGLLAGVSFAFCALNIVWLTHETLPAVAVMLPWMVWLVERIFERRRLGTMLGLALATAIGLGGGHPGMQVHLMVVTGLYVLARASFAHDAERPQRLRALALAGGGLVLGALLMGVMLVPELLSSHGTTGTIARRGGKGTLPGTVMPFDAIKTVLFPDWWGRPSALESQTGAAAVVNYNERTFYGGAVALILACVALTARGDWRRKAPFAIVAFIGLAVPLHAPGLYWLATHLPVLQDVQSQRLDFAFAFGAAVLGAFGLRGLIDAPGDARRVAAVLGAVGVGIVALAGTHASGADVGHTVRHFLTGADFDSAGTLALTSVVWFLLLALGVALAVLAARRWPRHSRAAAAIVVLLAGADMLHFVHGYQPMGPASKVIPPITPAISFLERHRDAGRIVGTSLSVLNDWSLLYGLDDVRGYDPPQPTTRYFDLWRVAQPEQLIWATFRLDGVSAEAVNILSVLGTRYVVGLPDTPIPPRDPTHRLLRPVYAGRDATVFENVRALPRALIAPAVRLTANADATRAAIAAPESDPRSAIVVERDQPGATSLAGQPPVHGSVAIAHEENASVTLRATLARRGLVVLNDTFTDGWTVRVDGHAAPPLHVNDVMRGVIVPSGRHEVVWSYAVPGLRLGLVLSLLALVAIGGGGVVLVVRGRGRAAATGAIDRSDPDTGST
jgi:hypothetical protein